MQELPVDEGIVATDHLTALRAGSVVGRYELLSVLGQGGFGITYRARDVQLGREVAIKEYLPTSLAVRQGDTQVLPRSTQLAADFIWGRDRFLEEARTLARLEGAPGIVGVYDFLAANGTAYMVMMLARGETLESRVRRDRRLAPGAIERLVPPLLSGLERVHEVGFLHRDIKPSNIILDATGAPTLIDFGASRMAVSDRTQALTAMFTPAYAALEQFSAANQGPWTDIYGLSATLYFCVKGQPPPVSAERTIDDTLTPLADEGGGYGRALLSAINAGLALRPSQRPQSIAAWRPYFDDERFRSREAEYQVTQVFPSGGQGSAEPKPSRSREGIAEAGKRRGRAVAAAAALLTVTALGAAYYWTSRSDQATGAESVAERVAAAEAAQARRKADEEAAAQRAADARRQADEARRAAEAKRRSEEEAKETAAAEARRKAEEEARERAAAEARRKAEQEARERAAAEARRKVEEEAKERAAAETRRKAEEEARERTAVEARRKAEPDARERAAAEARRKAEEEAKAREAAEARRKAEEEAKERQAAEARRKAEVEAKAREAAETQRKAEEEAKERQAAEARRKADEEAKAREAAEGRRKAEEEARDRQVVDAESALKLDAEARRRVQQALTIKGFETGGVDGVFGARTRQMIAAWQRGQGATPSGYLDGDQYSALMRDALALQAQRDAEEKQRLEKERVEKEALEKQRTEANRDMLLPRNAGKADDAVPPTQSLPSSRNSGVEQSPANPNAQQAARTSQTPTLEDRWSKRDATVFQGCWTLLRNFPTTYNMGGVVNVCSLESVKVCFEGQAAKGQLELQYSCPSLAHYSPFWCRGEATAEYFDKASLRVASGPLQCAGNNNNRWSSSRWTTVCNASGNAMACSGR